MAAGLVTRAALCASGMQAVLHLREFIGFVRLQPMAHLRLHRETTVNVLRKLVRNISHWLAADERERSATERLQWQQFRRWTLASFLLPIVIAICILASPLVGPWPTALTWLAWSLSILTVRELEPRSE